jgi:hypothetical protein
MNFNNVIESFFLEDEARIKLVRQRVPVQLMCTSEYDGFPGGPESVVGIESFGRLLPEKINIQREKFLN